MENDGCESLQTEPHYGPYPAYWSPHSGEKPKKNQAPLEKAMIYGGLGNLDAPRQCVSQGSFIIRRVCFVRQTSRTDKTKTGKSNACTHLFPDTLGETNF